MLNRAVIVIGLIALSGGPAAAAGDAAAGKIKAAACAGCHGANGQGVPPILRWRARARSNSLRR